jgi:hypothetical protein
MIACVEIGKGFLKTLWQESWDLVPARKGEETLSRMEKIQLEMPRRR